MRVLKDDRGRYILHFPYDGKEIRFLDALVENEGHLVFTILEHDPTNPQAALVVWKSKAEQQYHIRKP